MRGDGEINSDGMYELDAPNLSREEKETVMWVSSEGPKMRLTPEARAAFIMKILTQMNLAWFLWLVYKVLSG